MPPISIKPPRPLDPTARQNRKRNDYTHRGKQVWMDEDVAKDWALNGRKYYELKHRSEKLCTGSGMQMADVERCLSNLDVIIKSSATWPVQPTVFQEALPVLRWLLGRKRKPNQE